MSALTLDSTGERAVRVALGELRDTLKLLESASSVAAAPAAITALEREALRQASTVVPFASMADDERSRDLLQRWLGADLEAHEQAEASKLARAVLERTWKLLEARSPQAQRSRTRYWRALAAAVAAAVLAWAGQKAWVGLTAPKDLAKGRPFTQSSKWADCHPDRHECGGYPMNAVLHTLAEQSPWYQVDLGAPTTFSSATIVNRQDMAMSQAVPLVLEVSDDGTTFREVIRRPTVFVEWAPHFAPQTARYVRLRVDRFATLHLESVQVHP